MADIPLFTFKSNMRPLLLLLLRITVWGCLILIAAAVIGQLLNDRFPSYSDLFLAALIPLALCGIGALLFYAAVQVFPVHIMAGGLRCYDLRGRYRTVKWSDINGIDKRSMYGLRYFFLSAPQLESPLTLPLWLKDMSGFIAAAEVQAGSENLLVMALRTQPNNSFKPKPLRGSA